MFKIHYIYIYYIFYDLKIYDSPAGEGYALTIPSSIIENTVEVGVKNLYLSFNIESIVFVVSKYTIILDMEFLEYRRCLYF